MEKIFKVNYVFDNTYFLDCYQGISKEKGVIFGGEMVGYKYHDTLDLTNSLNMAKQGI